MSRLVSRPQPGSDAALREEAATPGGSGAPAAMAAALTPAEMRAMGYRVIDALVAHLCGVDERPLAATPSRGEMEGRLREGVPLEGSPFDVVLERALAEVFTAFTPHNHRRFFAMIPCPHDFISVLADALAAGFNPFGGIWKMAPGAAQIELITVDWLRELMGYPEGAGGLFVTGGSAATLTALAAAREAHLGDGDSDGVGYCSAQTHPSVDRAFRLLGLAPGALRRLAVDRRYRLDLAALRAQLRRDRADGRRPFCVVANAGTTNTAAVDPLPELADLCAAEGLWLHVDGAYGGAARISREGARLLRGIERSDSLTLDPHKWLFQPYEIGCVLVRARRHLQRAFRLRSE